MCLQAFEEQRLPGLCDPLGLIFTLCLSVMLGVGTIPAALRSAAGGEAGGRYEL